MTGPFDPYNSGSNDPFGQQYPGGGYQGEQSQSYGGAQLPLGAPQPTASQVANNPIDVGESFTQAWRGFIASWVPWVVSAVLFFVAAFVVFLIVFVPLVATAAADPNGTSDLSLAIFTGTGIIGFIALLVLAVYAVVWQLNCWRNALRVVRGDTITLGDFFKLNGLGWPIIAELVVLAICYIGLFLFVVPGIILAFILVFVVPAMFILQDASISTAFSLSWKIVSTQFGATILLFLVTILLSFVGSIVVVGVLVTTPLMHLLVTHALQRAVGGPALQRA